MVEAHFGWWIVDFIYRYRNGLPVCAVFESWILRGQEFWDGSGTDGTFPENDFFGQEFCGGLLRWRIIPAIG